jgi:hypothetical protein
MASGGEKKEETYKFFQLATKDDKLTIEALEDKEVKFDAKNKHFFMIPDEQYKSITVSCDKEMAHWRETTMKAEKSSMTLERILNLLSYLHESSAEGQTRGHRYSDKYRKDYMVMNGAKILLEFENPISEKIFTKDFCQGYGMCASIDEWIAEEIPEEYSPGFTDSWDPDE